MLLWIPGANVERHELVALEKRVVALERYRDANTPQRGPTYYEEKQLEEWVRLRSRIKKLEDRVKELEK